ncbi:tRNA adenosine(34) deaminase TadA [Ghiorsea bivora]|uniref:tRNA adenosine(34) deaminase TadA n=1 Tax=Ghiorsea bivora TaxID=1485545 RepID=UPI0005714751|nr:tRNA adenosine(34) deaminase TadA [Ghiorsea bivora]
MNKNHEDYMQLALIQAQLAADMDEVPVGAVLITDDGQVFSAHNAPINKHDATCHAEIEVIRKTSASIGNYRLLNSILYVTLEPCLMCAGAIIHARVGTVVYGAEDNKTGAVSSLYQVLSDKRLNHQPHIISGILQDECSQQLRAFFKAKRLKKKNA